MNIRSPRIHRCVRENSQSCWRAPSYGTCRSPFASFRASFCKFFHASVSRDRTGWDARIAYSRRGRIKILGQGPRRITSGKTASYELYWQRWRYYLLHWAWCLRQVPGLKWWTFLGYCTCSQTECTLYIFNLVGNVGRWLCSFIETFSGGFRLPIISHCALPKLRIFASINNFFQ